MQEPVDAALQQYADLSLLAEKRPASRRPTKLFVTARSQWATTAALTATTSDMFYVPSISHKMGTRRSFATGWAEI